jgi:hypothetical protein
MADNAVKVLREHGFRARLTTDGVSEWQAAGLPVECRADAIAMIKAPTVGLPSSNEPA